MLNSLPNDISEDRLQQELDRYGPVVKVHLLKAATNSQRTSLAHVFLAQRGDGAAAVEYINQAYLRSSHP